MAKYSFLSLGTLCLLVLFHGCLARQQQEHTQPQHQFRGEKSKCQLYNLDALEPFRRVEAEAGLIEYWDQNDDQFQCAGVAAFRITIEPNGLALPAYHNAPQLIYVVQGKGVLGLLLPGCPETFQRHQQSEDQDSRSQTSTKQDRKSKRSEDQYSKSQRLDDQHQKLRFFKQGDIIAVPNGAAYWFYNDGDTPVVAFSFSDTTNNVNQLDDRMRKFYLAGHVQEEQEQQQQQQQQRGSSSSRRQQKAEQESSGNNIFSGFDVKLLAQAYGVRKETARKLQGENDQRGPIIHVKEGLQVIKSILSEDEEQQQEKNVKENGFEETLCNMRLRQNIDKAASADIYTPLGGRVTNLNSQSLPILGFLQLSAERGYLYKNSMLSPHWNMNAHSVIYVLSGEARVQIVGDSGHTVFDGQLRKNQLLILPQNYAIVKQAGDDGFEWISFKTNDNAMISSLAGRASVIRSMPEEILVNSYQISNEEARRLKFKREEMLVFKPKSESHGRSAAM